MSLKIAMNENPALVRAMVNTLFDHHADPFDEISLAMTLINAGFSVKDIETYWDQIQTMACMRQRNKDRRRVDSARR